MEKSKEKMYFYYKNDLKNHSTNNGITLIALVVTIIVLLILAGISIQMITGQSGILGQAGTARDKSGRANVIEDAQRDLLDEMTKQETEITEDILKGVLNKYFSNVPDKLPDDLSTLTLTSRDGKYNDILASEVYKGAFGKTQTGERLEDMYYLEGEYNDETGKIENIRLSLLPNVEVEIIKIILDKKLPNMTDEEILAKASGYETFEELMENLIEQERIDKKYASAKELYYALMAEEEDNYPYEYFILDFKAQLFGAENMEKISFNNPIGDRWMNDIPIDGMGNYEFTIKFEDEEIFSFTITIDQYEIIDWTGKNVYQAISVYDFKNEKILKIDEASYEYQNEYEYEPNFESGIVSDEKIIAKDEGSYIDIKMEDNYIYRYKILYNGKYIIGYIEGRRTASDMR